MSEADRVIADHLSAGLADPAPRALGIAVSGGSDSLALLYLLKTWSTERDVRLRAATVDHGLRPEAAVEANTVAGHCAALGVPHQCLPWTGWDGQGNLQDQARRARYRLLSDWARHEALTDVALGHTLDDQAETFVMGLARGAGLDGLSGMRLVFSRDDVRFRRPLLGVRRGDLRAYLTGLGVEWIEDPSNRNERFDRVKARHILQALAPLGITADSLGQTIGNLRSTRTSISVALADWARNQVKQDRGDLLIAVDAFVALPQDFARRVLNAALRWISGADYPPRSDAVMQLVREPRRQRMTLHGCLIAFTGLAIRVGREAEAAKRATARPTDALWDRRWRMTGPHAPDLEIRALGVEGLHACPDWRATGIPRASLLSSPAIWRNDALISAPIAGYSNGWRAELAHSRDDFIESLISH